VSEQLCLEILRVLEGLKINAAMGVTTQEVGPSDWSIIVPPADALNLTAIVEGVRDLGVTVHLHAGTLLFVPPPDDLPEGVEVDGGEAWADGVACRQRHGKPCPTMPCELCGNGDSFLDASSFEFGVTRDVSRGPRPPDGAIWTPGA
jgi:hypothetical protein